MNILNRFFVLLVALAALLGGTALAQNHRSFAVETLDELYADEFACSQFPVLESFGVGADYVYCGFIDDTYTLTNQGIITRNARQYGLRVFDDWKLAASDIGVRGYMATYRGSLYGVVVSLMETQDASIVVFTVKRL